MAKGNEQQQQGHPANASFLERPNTDCIKEYMKFCSGMKVGQRRNLLAMSPSSREDGKSSKLQHVQSSLLAGVGSGTLSSIVCAPLDLIRTRMQVMGDLKNHSSSTSNPSLVSNLRDIVQMDGIRGCFRGLSATLMTVPFFWGLYFPLYEHLKQHFHDLFDSTTKKYNTDNVTATSTSEEGSLNILQFEEPSESILLQKRPTKQPGKEEVSSMVHLCAAISAGAVADCICNPLFVVRTRMQTEALHYMDMPVSERKPHSIGRTIIQLYQEGGILIFWRGLTASLLGLIHVGIQFPIYEKIKAEARNRSPTNEESPFDLLMASGLSKMIACSLTYPHEVLRSRMMDFRGNNKTGLLGTYQRIVTKEGYAALYTGLSVTLVRVIPNCCITFMSYEILLRYVKQHII